MSLGKFSAARVNAWWYNPRNGKGTFLGTYANDGTRSFDPPGSKGRGNDWVLILDDAAKNYAAPDGTKPGNAPPPIADADTTYRFYKAINFAGKALSIDGRNWQAGTAGGYSHNGRSFTNRKAGLSPDTDDAREQMIRSSIWHYKQLKLTLTGLPEAAYRVYLYTWEDNASQTYSMTLEGQTIVSSRSSGAAGTWKKHGPFKARVSDGTMQVTTTGQVNVSGIELWQEEINAPVASCSATGTILRELWRNVPGNAIADVPVSEAPSFTSQLTSLETPADRGDHYGTRVRGYVCPPTTGNYTFWVAGDDIAELWLSTNDAPSGKVKIAYTFFTSWREWTKYPSQRSATIRLEAGKKYYLEVLHKEAAGRDGVSVGWQLPNGTLERPIPGSRLSPYAAPAARMDSQPEDLAQEEPEAEATRVFPNPADDQVTFTFSAQKPGAVDVLIHDATGREAKRVRVQAGVGTTTVVIGIADLAPGFYFIRGGSDVIKKLVIDR